MSQLVHDRLLPPPPPPPSLACWACLLSGGVDGLVGFSTDGVNELSINEDLVGELDLTVVGMDDSLRERGEGGRKGGRERGNEEGNRVGGSEPT